ncbi:MAG: hypothetical protein FWH01_09750 [Oscillospiraceae bacterium]|nr:hypothetical protein [Oscillospiraceae bacterium]
MNRNSYYYGGNDYFVSELLSTVLPIIGIIIVAIIIINVVRRVMNAKSKGISSRTGSEYGFMGLRGKTKEQKKIIKFFMSTGILGAIFKISNSTFDTI